MDVPIVDVDVPVVDVPVDTFPDGVLTLDVGAAVALIVHINYDK